LSIVPDKTIKVYTSITGEKDEPRDDIEVFDFYPYMVLPVHQAKVFKVLSHQFIEDADYSIWLDGNIKLLIDPDFLVQEWLWGYDIAVWKHFGRDCIYDEASEIERLWKGKIPLVREQVEHYRKQGHPEHWGLAECNVIVRKHTDAVKRFNDAWWSEICRWSWRDQLSFPYVARTNPSVRVNYVHGNPRDHRYFKYRDHIR